jgi:tRNA dimethylallyltransferase
VLERLAQGALREVEQLLQLPGVSPLLLTATGVAEIKAHLAQESTYEELIEKWVTREYQYAKRQLTWWRHDGKVTWLEAANTAAWTEVIANL